METKYYSAERNVQILVSLLKQHGIKNSPRIALLWHSWTMFGLSF